MKRYFVKILLSLTLVVAGCLASGSGNNEKEPDNPTPPPTESDSLYTSASATAAFESFNDHFYSLSDNLYFSTTTRRDLAVGWTQALFFNMVMDIYQRTDDAKYLDQINSMYDGAKSKYSNFKWTLVRSSNGWIYDDMMWWVGAMARAYQITGDQKYLDDAMAGFDFVWEQSYDEENGGMNWSWKASGKVAAVNYPTVIAAMRLYHITENDTYLSKAKEIYHWARKNLFQESTGRVADHKVGDDPAGFEDYTYNQGTAIGAATMLYLETDSSYYLDDAKWAAEYTRDEMSNDKGILPAEGDWNEQGVLKAIFVRNMDLLIDDAGQDQYLDWMQKNAQTAWNNRDKDRTLMYRDYDVQCPKGEIQSYEASSGVEFMQVILPPSN